MMRWGYGTLCIGSFIVLAGLVTSWMYAVRVVALEKLLAGDGLLAYWTYTASQKDSQIGAEYKERIAGNRTLFLIMAVFFLMIGSCILGVDFLAEGEFNTPFAVIFFGVLLLLGFVAWLAPRWERRKARKADLAAYIGKRALYFNGKLFVWGDMLNRLEGVVYNRQSQPPKLTFSIRMLTAQGAFVGDTYQVEIPVPLDQTEAAQKIEANFSPQ